MGHLRRSRELQLQRFAALAEAFVHSREPCQSCGKATAPGLVVRRPKACPHVVFGFDANSQRCGTRHFRLGCLGRDDGLQALHLGSAQRTERRQRVLLTPQCCRRLGLGRCDAVLALQAVLMHLLHLLGSPENLWLIPEALKLSLQVLGRCPRKQDCSGARRSLGECGLQHQGLLQCLFYFVGMSICLCGTSVAAFAADFARRRQQRLRGAGPWQFCRRDRRNDVRVDRRKLLAEQPQRGQRFLAGRPLLPGPREPYGESQGGGQSGDAGAKHEVGWPTWGHSETLSHRQPRRANESGQIPKLGT
mmetsp:Transcript_20993/g.58627  ORF Transcript_20993/g.58627 Transcript_20993/m.58627 type:complete len:305 (-) Transcript_20993:26-940(-)